MNGVLLLVGDNSMDDGDGLVGNAEDYHVSGNNGFVPVGAE
jgi:hypothetical protein